VQTSGAKSDGMMTRLDRWSARNSGGLDEDDEGRMMVIKAERIIVHDKEMRWFQTNTLLPDYLLLICAFVEGQCCGPQWCWCTGRAMA
jgi:hypothetical protein